MTPFPQESSQSTGKATALAGQTPEEIHNEVVSRFGLPDAIVSNDVYPITRNDIEAIPIDDLRATFEAVVMVPIRLSTFSMFLKSVWPKFKLDQLPRLSRGSSIRKIAP
jgi:hypothetical protein